MVHYHRVMMVNVHEAKTNLSRLLERVEAGERVVIARAGKPIADLVAHVRPDLSFGTLRGELRYPDDFDAPDPAVVELFEGR